MMCQPKLISLFFLIFFSHLKCGICGPILDTLVDLGEAHYKPRPGQEQHKLRETIQIRITQRVEGLDSRIGDLGVYARAEKIYLGDDGGDLLFPKKMLKAHVKQSFLREALRELQDTHLSDQQRYEHLKDNFSRFWERSQALEFYQLSYRIPFDNQADYARMMEGQCQRMQQACGDWLCSGSPATFYATYKACFYIATLARFGGNFDAYFAPKIQKWLARGQGPTWQDPGPSGGYEPPASQSWVSRASEEGSIDVE